MTIHPGRERPGRQCGGTQKQGRSAHGLHPQGESTTAAGLLPSTSPTSVVATAPPTVVVIVVVLLLMLLVLLLRLRLRLRLCLCLCRRHPARKAAHTTIRAPGLGPTVHARPALSATALRRAVRQSLASITGNTRLARRRLPILGILPTATGRAVSSTVAVKPAIAAHSTDTHGAHTGSTGRVIATAGGTTTAGSAANSAAHASVSIAAAATATDTRLHSSSTRPTTCARPAAAATAPEGHAIGIATLSLRWLLHVGVAITVWWKRLPIREAHARENTILTSGCRRRRGRCRILPKTVATTAAVPTTVVTTIADATGRRASQIAQVSCHRRLLLLR